MQKVKTAVETAVKMAVDTTVETAKETAVETILEKILETEGTMLQMMKDTIMEKVSNASSEMKGNELIKKEMLGKYLKLNYDQDFDVYGHKSPSQLENYSMFSKSKPDFSLKCRKLLIHDDSTVHVGLAVSGKKENEDEFKEVDDVCVGVTGDCKEDATDNDDNQIIANMIKLAGDAAYELVRDNKLFKRMIVYGLLVDYSTPEATSFRLILNFHRQSYELLKSRESLEIGAAFARHTSFLLLNQKK